MPDLADVVALLQAPEPRCRTLQVVGREWRHHALLHEAFMAATPPGALVATMARASGGPEPEEGEETWRWWSQAPESTRVEFAFGVETLTAWFRGTTWWSWSPSQGARTNEGHEDMGHGKGPGEILVSPAPLAQVLDLGPLGRHTFLDRQAYRLRARPLSRGRARNLADATLHSLGRGADEYDLVVDAERGFLLRAAAKLNRKPFRVLEMTEVVVDGDLPAGVFMPQAPEHEPFEYFEPTRRLSLEELPAAVPFKVFVPARPPGRLAIVHVRNAEPRRGIALSATICYLVPKADGGHANLWVHQSAEPEQAVPQPTKARSQVDEFTVSTDQSMGCLRCKVFLEREGTHIHLESTAMALDELIALARSLVPLAPWAAS